MEFDPNQPLETYSTTELAYWLSSELAHNMGISMTRDQLNDIIHEFDLAEKEDRLMD